MQFNEEIILKGLSLANLELKTHQLIDSTNDECKRISSNKDILVVTADKQTKGKGRKGKKWHSPEGNISLSIAFADIGFDMPISIATGILVRDALTEVFNLSSIKLKWPNDLVYEKKKIGGILVEKEVFANYTKAIVGIGINLELDKKESWWGDLKDFNGRNLRDKIINSILMKFEILLKNGLDDWKSLWHESCIHNNAIISVARNNETIKGKYQGINDAGELLLEKETGNIISFSSGEVSIKGIYNK
jgi:BirA family biotin operon repressor/biotin-[acetyl-CoA-carboxylase] ligase